MPIKKNTNYEIYLGGYTFSRRKVKKVALNTTSLILYKGDEYDLIYSIYLQTDYMRKLNGQQVIRMLLVLMRMVILLHSKWYGNNYSKNK